MMKLLRLPEVCRLVNLSVPSIYRFVKKGNFPAPVKQGTASFWVDTEIETYLQQLVTARPTSRPTDASS